MNELIDLVLTEIRSALRFRWYGIGVAWLVALGGWSYVMTMPDVFEATARVYVDTSSVLQPVLQDQIVTPNIDAELAFVRESLLGTERLAAVARAVGLDANVRGAGDREALLRRLREQIQVRTEAINLSRNVSNNIYSITYRNAARERAIAVVSTLLDAFVEDTLGARISGTDTAGRFLAERIEEYERRLQRAEQARADFMRRHADRLPGTQGDYFTRLQSQREALEAANQELSLLEARRSRLVEQLRGETPVTDDGGRDGQGPAPNSIDARVADYEARLEMLLLEYTDRHPDVIALRETLDRLKAQRDEQLAALGVSSGRELSSLGANPVYQALQISLNEVEVEIAALKTDIETRQRTVENLQSLMNEVPEVEAQLAQLNRDYDVIYGQYTRLVQSRETQELTRQAAATDQIDFRIIDPPSAPQAPVAPQRLRLIATAFIAALGAGAGLCYVFSQVWPVFGSVRALQEQLEFPVLGTVAHAWQERQKRERRLAVFAFAVPVVALVLAFGAVVVIEVAGPGINGLYEQVTR